VSEIPNSRHLGSRSTFSILPSLFILIAQHNEILSGMFHSQFSTRDHQIQNRVGEVGMCLLMINTSLFLLYEARQESMIRESGQDGN
jgi:hypothetical protein